jgi:hypothetical protein
VEYDLRAGRVRRHVDRVFLTDATVPGGVIRPSAFDSVHENQAKLEMGDTQHVTGPEAAAIYTLAVDPGSVGAAQVANDNLGAGKTQATVATGYPRRVEPNLTSSIAADQRQRTVEVEGCGSVQCDETGEHQATPVEDGAAIRIEGNGRRSLSRAQKREVASRL